MTSNLRRIFAVAICCFFVEIASQGRAEACGWWGDGDRDDSDEVVLVDADGKPVPDEGMPMDDPAVQTRIGNRFRTGEGAVQDYAKALYWYRKAATQGYAGAQNNLAIMHEEGLGVPKDEQEALKWYRRSAEQGNGYAQHSLGSMYRDGRGGPRNSAEAAKWIRKAAEQGHKGAFRDMGELYWRGTGVPRDFVQAYMWWKLAARFGDSEGKQLHEKAAGEITPDEISEADMMVREWRPTETP